MPDISASSPSPRQKPAALFLSVPWPYSSLTEVLKVKNRCCSLMSGLHISALSCLLLLLLSFISHVLFPLSSIIFFHSCPLCSLSSCCFLVFPLKQYRVSMETKNITTQLKAFILKFIKMLKTITMLKFDQGFPTLYPRQLFAKLLHKCTQNGIIYSFRPQKNTIQCKGL